MIYNFSRYCVKPVLIIIAVLLVLGVLTVRGAATDGGSEGNDEVPRLILSVLKFDDGGYIELSVGSSQVLCGVLAEIVYDAERLTFLTFSVGDGVGGSVVVSCADDCGDLRLLVDGEDNFESDVWCRLLFAVNEDYIPDSAAEDYCSELVVSVVSAYALSDDGYAEICIEKASAFLELGETPRQDEDDEAVMHTVSADWVDFGTILEGYCAISLSGFAEGEAFAAGFEIWVSCEGIAEFYTVTQVLSARSHEKRKYTVIVFLPMRDSFRIEVTAVGYTPIGAARNEDKRVFFISGSKAEPIGSFE